MMKKRKFGSGGMPSTADTKKSVKRIEAQEEAEMRFMGVGQKPKKKTVPATRSTLPSMKAIVDAGNRASAADTKDLKAVQKYAKGGKVKPVDIDMKGLEEASRSTSSLPKADLETKAAEARNLNAVRAKETSDTAKKKSFKEAFNEARKEQGPNGVFTWRGNAYNTKMAGETSKAAPARAAAPTPNRAAAPATAPASRPAAPAATAPASRPAATPPAASANKPSKTGSPMSSVIRNLDSGYDLDAEAKKIMAKRNDSFFRAPISMKEAREEARAEAENVRKMSGYRAEQERKKKSLEAGRRANPNLVDRFVKMTMNPGRDYAKGGVTRADGCAVRGKTKGKMV